MVEIGLCKAELRTTGTRCPTCDRRCKVDFGIFGCDCGWFGQRFSRSVRFCGERLECGIFGCAVSVAVRFVRQFGYAVEIGRCKAELDTT